MIIFHASLIAGQTMVRNEKGKKVGLSLVYPPPHLYHILFELFKNSMRATVETHNKSRQLPEIEVLVAKGEHDVSIRVSDQVIYLQFCRFSLMTFLYTEGRWYTSSHNRSHVPLFVLYSTTAFHDSNQSTLGWLWLWPSPVKALCSLLSWRPDT